jgi:diguanylate cyclase (GGDEF)-like protein/PAS domain S-box-containing protein
VSSASGPEGIERRFRTDSWRAPAAIAAIGLDGRVLACNDAYAEIMGETPADLVGVDSGSFVHPEEVDRAVAQSVSRMGTQRNYESRPTSVRLLRRNGTTAWVQFDSVLIDDAGPDAPYVLTTMTDVSAQVDAQAAVDRSDSWFRALLREQSDIVTVVTFDGVLQYISPNCERLLGFPADQMIGTDGAANIHADDIGALMDGIATQLAEGADAQPIAYRQRRRDGSWLWLEATARELPAEFGMQAVIVNARDVSERRRADAAARETERRFRDAFATSPLGIAFADLDGRFTWVNHALAETLGVTEPDLLTMGILDFATWSDLATEVAETRRLLTGEIESFSSERLYEHPSGATLWTRLHVSLVRSADGAPAQLLGQLEDITSQKHRELSLTHDARHDPLTGLLNRAGLREHVDAAWAARTPDEPLAVLFGDLDGFKGVNDNLGHDAGDEVLIHVAQRLRTAVRDRDVVARWGGDEFVILCPSVSSVDDATCIAERIRSALHAPFRVGPGLAEIGISIGVAFDTGQPLPDLLIKDADAAAYAAKKRGRNLIVVS